MAHEIDFQKRLWQGDYAAALGCAESVLGGLNDTALRGYRALWHYFAGSAAWLGSHLGNAVLTPKVQIHFSKAKGAAIGIAWLVMLAEDDPKMSVVGSGDSLLLEQIDRLEMVLEHFGTSHDRKFALREKEILEGLVSSNQNIFEHAHMLLGELLGFDSNNEHTEGAPDPWWIAGNLCFVFEDHAGADRDSILDVKKARQVSSHPNWMRKKVGGASQAEIVPVLITPVSKVSDGARIHLDGVALWPLDDFRTWAQSAIAAVRKLRQTFYEPGDIEWRATAVSAFKESELDAPGLAARLRSKSWSTQLESVRSM